MRTWHWGEREARPFPILVTRLSAKQVTTADVPPCKGTAHPWCVQAWSRAIVAMHSTTNRRSSIQRLIAKRLHERPSLSLALGGLGLRSASRTHFGSRFFFCVVSQPLHFIHATQRMESRRSCRWVDQDHQRSPSPVGAVATSPEASRGQWRGLQVCERALAECTQPPNFRTRSALWKQRWQLFVPRTSQ